MASRFQKKSAPKLPSVPGTRPSLFNYQLLTSSGVPGLDQLLGGGYPIGTVSLIEDLPNKSGEECGQNYSQLLQQYFLSEGCFFGHKLFSVQAQSSSFQLPAIVTNDGSSITLKQDTGRDDGKMKIAWRYENQSPKEEELKGSSNHHFNLNKAMPQEIVSELMSSWSLDASELLEHKNFYDTIFNKVAEATRPFEIDPKVPCSNILRVSISDIGCHLLDGSNTVQLMTFLYRLRALARSHLVVVILHLSSDFFVSHEAGGKTHISVKELVDFVIDLTAFNKAERQNGVFKDHHGLIELEKAANLNCLSNNAIMTNVRAKHLFKSLRTKFSIAPMHLPPDVDISNETKKSLDF